MDNHPRQQHHSWQKFTFLGGHLERPEAVINQPPSPRNTPRNIPTSFPLSQAHPGDLVWIVDFTAGAEGLERLVSMGLTRGTEVEIINRTAGGSIMVAIANTRLGLGVSVADKIYVRSSVMHDADAALHQADLNVSSNQHFTQEKSMQTRLRDLAVGSQGRVTGYDQGSASYRQKLLAMGLTTGTEFTITRQAPLGDPVELQVRGFQLSLRKTEADALIVELVESKDHA